MSGDGRDRDPELGGGGGDGNGNGNGNGAGSEGEQRPRPRTVAEWTTLAVSAALVLAVVGLTVVLAVAGGDRPPVVEARPLLDRVRREGDRFYLPVEVTNRGSRTAEEVTIRTDLATGDAEESAEFTVNFLAGGESAEATVAFGEDPAAGELTVGVVSFR